MSKTYQVKYRVNGQPRSERIVAPDMESAERQWKGYRQGLNYTGFTIFNPDHQ